MNRRAPTAISSKFPAVTDAPSAAQADATGTQELLIAQWYDAPAPEERAAWRAPHPPVPGLAPEPARARWSSPAAQDASQPASFAALESRPKPRASKLSRAAIGVLAIAVGLLLSLLAYASAASSGGGIHLLASGPISYGLMRLVRALGSSADLEG